MVLVQMGNDRGRDIAGRVAEPVQSRREGLLRADVEPGQPAVQQARYSAGEVVRLGDGGPVLPRVEQDQAVAVLDDVRVDGPGPGPGPGGEQPHRGRAPG